MNGGPLPISWWGLAGAAALLGINGLLSIWLGLGLGRRLLVAGLRTVVQLLILGTLLVPIFRWQSVWPILLVGLAMIALASTEAVRRQRRAYRGISIATFAALFIAASTTTVLGSALFVRVEPWWQPRYLLPLLGMILGNGLTGISLGVDRCLDLLDAGKDRVEARLAAGATMWEAARPVASEAVRTGMIPIINSMSVVGLVTIPGMMTGQLLAGSPPDVAARYQILIMFLIAAAVATGSVVSVLFSIRTLFDDAHRLRPERLMLRRVS